MKGDIKLFGRSTRLLLITQLFLLSSIPVLASNRIILKRNQVNGAAILTQDMVNEANTLYIIQDDFSLGSNIVMPENCTLEFVGGSISNRDKLNTIKGNNTTIIAPSVKIFTPNTILSGTWNVKESYPEWFGAKSNSIDNAAPAIQNCINSFGRVVLNGSYRAGSTLYLLNSTELVGNRLYKTNIIFDKGIQTGITQHPNIETLRGCSIKNIVISKDTKTINSSGILLKKSTQIDLEAVTVVRFGYGFDLNCIYTSSLKRCDATSCDVGFYFGRNNGNSTSISIESCYALKCDIGYELKRLNYSTLSSCACDQGRIAYDFWHSNVTLNSCGCESITERIISLSMHKNEDPMLNKNGNAVNINNLQAIQCSSKVPPILIAAGTRLADDRNIVSINGLTLGTSKEAKFENIVEYSGDTQLYLSKITVPRGSISLFDNKKNYVPFSAYACSHIFIEGKRYVTVSLQDKVVKRYIGDTIYIYDGGSFVEFFWNGEKWVDITGRVL